MASAILLAVVLGSSVNVASALALNSSVSSVLGAIREAYTTNAICAKNKCINPVFPGMEDLHRLQQAKFICSSLHKTSTHMGFCRNAITYDPALPVPSGGSASIKKLVQRQDNAAATMFYYHTAGLGLEAWDYQKPEFADDCIKSIWRMVCYTYFPRAEIGCQDGAFTNYIRPCRSSCQNYIRSCGVECCDESVQCVFSHTKSISPSQKVTTEGYLPHDGPSSLCTGAARRSTTPLGVGFWALVVLKALFHLDSASLASGMRSFFGGGRKVVLISALAVLALSLQGCSYDVPVHTVGNWRAEPDYLMKNEFVPPGGSARSASLNSCSIQRLSQTLQCSGRGVCKLWDTNNMDNTLSFCECDRDWADPECRTKRKSQLVAYLLSMFFGFLGLDQFYLGFTLQGIVKLLTFGGCGVLWVMDFIAIGSAPVYAADYRAAADLPHFAFVLTATMYAVLLGFGGAYYVTVTRRAKKRAEAMILHNDEEGRQKDVMAPLFTDAYGPGKTRPVIRKEPGMDFDPSKMSGQGYGAMGGMGPMGMGMGGPPTMGMGGGMPPNMGMGGPPTMMMGGPPSMGMPQSMGMGMGPTPSNRF